MSENDLEIPEGLSAEAADLFADIVEDIPDISAAEYQSALQAARLVTMADALEDAVGSDLIVSGSTGQAISHPALTEARQARTAALTALGRIRRQRQSASAAGAALVANRWGRRG